jgi:hypothetical protein
MKETKWSRNSGFQEDARRGMGKVYGKRTGR